MMLFLEKPTVLSLFFRHPSRGAGGIDFTSSFLWLLSLALLMMTRFQGKLACVALCPAQPSCGFCLTLKTCKDAA